MIRVAKIPRPRPVAHSILITKRVVPVCNDDEKGPLNKFNLMDKWQVCFGGS